MPPLVTKDLSDNMDLAELRQRFLSLETGQTELKHSVDNIAKALVGDTYGNTGFCGRLDNLEKRVILAEQVADRHEKKFITWTAYIVALQGVLILLLKFYKII